MLIKNITKPDDWEDYAKSRNTWIKKHLKMADTNIDNLLNPVCLGDKITWCDINCKYDDRFFNKEQAKIEVAKILGTEEYCIPTYQVCSSIDEIDFNALVGKRVVIKPRALHDSYGVVIHRKKLKKSDIPELIETCKNNKYLQDTKIVVERYIGDPGNKENFQRDYKFWCFNGKPVFVLVIGRRDKNGHGCCFFDLNFKHMELYRARQGIADWTKIKKPKNFEKMVEIASKISKNMPVVRVDLYNINGKIFFGECQKMYGFHCKFTNPKQNEKMSYLLNLNKIKPDILKIDEMKYDIKTSLLTKKAQEILKCNEDQLSFEFSNNWSPVYFNTSKPENGIIYDNGFWFHQEYNDDGTAIGDKKIYNKNTKEFEPIRIEEATKFLGTLFSVKNESYVKYAYDEDGDVVYYHMNYPELCIKYNKETGQFEQNYYEVVRRKIDKPLIEL